MTRIGNGPINPLYKLQMQPNQPGKGLNFQAWWEGSTVTTNTVVGIKAVGKPSIQGNIAEIRIFQLLGGQVHIVDSITAPYVNGKVSAIWKTKPNNVGNVEEGVYHFEIQVGRVADQTVKPLLVRDLNTRRNQDGFDIARAKPKVVF